LGRERARETGTERHHHHYHGYIIIIIVLTAGGKGKGGVCGALSTVCPCLSVSFVVFSHGRPAPEFMGREKHTSTYMGSYCLSMCTYVCIYIRTPACIYVYICVCIQKQTDSDGGPETNRSWMPKNRRVPVPFAIRPKVVVLWVDIIRDMLLRAPCRDQVYRGSWLFIRGSAVRTVRF
jgi:hypothetical protein